MAAKRTKAVVVASVLGWCASSASGQPLPARDHNYGVMVDAGMPDGVNTSFIYRPAPQLRLHAGGGYNFISQGVRAGVTMLVLDNWISPSFSLELGHYFAGNANGLAGALIGDQGINLGVLQSVGYNYGNGHIGVEVGIRRFTFYLHLGMSFMMTEARQLNELFTEAAEPGEPMIEIRDDPSLLFYTVSARLGVIVYF